MAAQTQTKTWDAIATTTMDKFRPTLVDNISKSNALLYTLMKKREAGYVSVEGGLGLQAVFPLMYAFGDADVYSMYDLLDTTPVDGLTVATWPWAQFAIPVMIARFEERQNAGKVAMLNLLKTKVKQQTIGIKEKFNKAFLWGNGINTAAQVTTPFTSARTNRQFIDPIAKLIAFTPSSGIVGNINPANETWWQNQTLTDGSSTFAGFLYNLDDLYSRCEENEGGPPDLHVTGRREYLLYVAALRSQNRFVEYNKADIPFENVSFHGNPVVKDQYMIDAATPTVVQSNTSGTWYMWNTEYMQIQYDSETNWMNTDWMQAINQDARVMFIKWIGSAGMSQRRKHGVMGSIDTTIVA